MSCPWAKIKKPEPVNFEDIMSEEVARELQAEEEKKYADRVDSVEVFSTEIEDVVDIPYEVLEAITDDGFESDAMIAQMLQMQFDKEYDEELKRTEEKFNGSSKVSVSFDNYRRAPLNNGFGSHLEVEEIVDVVRDRKDWDRFDILARESLLYHNADIKCKKMENGNQT